MPLDYLKPLQPLAKDLKAMVCSLSWKSKLIIFGGMAAIIYAMGYYNLPRTIENTEITGIGTTQVAYDTGATDYLVTSLDYKYIPKIYVKGHEKCLAGENMEGLTLTVGTKLESVSYSPTINGECDDLEDLILK